MNKKLLLGVTSLFVMLCSTLILPANAASTWNQTYGGVNSDTVQSLIEAPDGGYVLAGSWESSEDEDFWLLKTDPFGYEQWSQRYGAAGKDGVGKLNMTADGGYIMAGYTTSFGAGDYDAWLVKLNSLAQIQWNKTYGGADNDYAVSLVTTSDGGYVFAGVWNSTTYSGLDDGLAFQTPHGDFWLVKTTATGDMLWSRTYGGTGDERATSLVATSDGGFAIAGCTNSYGAGDYDFWLVKTNAAGYIEWSKTYGDAGLDYALSLVATPGGGYAMAGTSSFYSDEYLDFCLVKTDAMGNMEWSRTYGGEGTDIANALVNTTDNGYAIAGQTRSLGAGNFDFWLIKTDNYGFAQWNQTYGGAAADTATTLIATSDGGYALAGTAWSYGINGDIWLIKTDALGVYPEYTSLLIPAIVLTTTAFLIISRKRLHKRSQEP